MIKYVVLSFFALIFGFVVYVFIHLGVFQSVTVEESAEPAMILLYKENYGPYHKVNTVISEIESWAKANNLACEKTFGLYFDNPKVVDELRLRSHVGCLIDSVPSSVPAEYKIETIEPKKYIKAKFDGSPAVSPYKVYPAMQDFVFKHRIQTKPEFFEIYQTLSAQEMLTTYLQEVVVD